MKTTIVIFGNVSKKKGASISFFNYQVIQFFALKDALYKVYCLDSDVSVSDAIYNHVEKFSGTYKSRVYYILSTIVSKVIPSISSRHIMEWFFDLHVKGKLKKGKSNLLINLKATVPNTCKKAKKISMPVVSLVTISHPEFIYEQIKKIIALYGLEENSPYTNKAWREWYIRGLFESDSIIFRLASDYVKETYTDRAFDTNKIIWISNNNGVDIDKFKLKASYSTECIVFLAIGGATLKKGIPLLLEAWKALDKEYYNKAKLLIVDSIENENNKRLLQTGYVFESISFLQYSNEIEQVYQNADVFVAPTIADLGPRTVTEAMTVGLPCIVSNQCGMSEWINDGVCGFVYSPFDILSLKEKLEFFIDNPDKIAEFGKEARKVALGFDTDRFSEELFNICQNKLIL